MKECERIWMTYVDMYFQTIEKHVLQPILA